MVQQGWLLQRASEMCLLQVLSHFLWLLNWPHVTVYQWKILSQFLWLRTCPIFGSVHTWNGVYILECVCNKEVGITHDRLVGLLSCKHVCRRVPCLGCEGDMSQKVQINRELRKETKSYCTAISSTICIQWNPATDTPQQLATAVVYRKVDRCSRSSVSDTGTWQAEWQEISWFVVL